MDASRRVLFVDDDPSVGTAFARVASRLGYHVELAQRGSEALALLQRQRYPVVALDFWLPDVDGVKLAEQLTSLDPAAAFVFVTADPSFVRPGSVDGAVASLLQKPWDEEKLASALEQAFHLHDQRLHIKATRADEALPILLVEDSASDTYLISQQLRAEPNVQVTCVTRLAAAVELLHQQRFDTIVSDLGLPDGRGLDAIQRLRAAAPDATIVICSGTIDEALMLRAIQLGAQDFVSKDAISDNGALLRTVHIARQRRQADRELARLAYQDALTGLANRSTFEDHLNKHLARARRLASTFSLLFIDLDGFKQVNDEHGHEAGDELLRVVAGRMRKLFREYDVVARLGGDEFCVLLSDVGDPAVAMSIAERLMQSLLQPVNLLGRSIGVTSSVGVAMYPGAGESTTEIMRHADEAMYQAKRGGKNRGQLWSHPDEVAEVPTIVVASPPRTQATNVVQVANVVQYDSERRAVVEAALIESENRFRLLAETLPQLVWTCLPDGRCDYLSPQWVAYTGIAESEQLDFRWLLRLHPDDRERTTSEWNAAVLAGTQFDIEFRLQRHDEVYRWFKARAVPMRDESGDIVRWFGTNTDIHDLRESATEVRTLTTKLKSLLAERRARRSSDRAEHQHSNHDEILQAHDKLQHALCAGLIGVWDWNIRDNVLEWDDTMFALYGIERSAFGGAYDDWKHALHPEDSILAEAALELAVAGERPFEHNYRIVRPSGEVRYIRATGAIERAKDGTAVRVLGTNVDITDLLKTRERLMIASRSGKLGVWEYNVETTEVEWDESVYQMLAIKRSQYADATDAWKQLVHPDDAVSTEQAMKQAIAEARPMLAVARLRRPSGEWIHLRVSATPVTDSEGRVTRLHGVNVDISDLIAAQNQLVDEERRFQGLLEAAPDAIVVVNVDGDIALVNAHAHRLFDYEVDELVGQPIEVLIPERLRDIHLQHRKSYVVNPRPRDMGKGIRLFGRRKDGSEFPMEVGLSPIHTSDGTLVVAAVRDVTEHRRLEQQLTDQNIHLTRSNQELEQFAYAASHDLQEPLRAVAGCAQILARKYQDKLDADADELVRHIVDGAFRMKRLIQDLLDLSRVGPRGRLVEGVSSEDALHDALGNLKTAIAESHAIVTFASLPVLHADATQLTMLLQNLIGNALKYRGDRAPEIHVGAQRVEHAWQFEVRDNGIGIDPAYFEKIFGVFQRLHTRDDYPGTGIGLALCRKIVEQHGGRIWLESQPNVGSTFYFTIADKTEDNA